MRLRPSTPLSVLLAVALGLLVLAVISTPVIKQIPLGEFNGYKFGVFGYCDADDKCSSIGIGYKDLGDTLSSNDDAFDLPTGVRETLSAVLILHPVAAGLVLVMLIMAISSHFHAPAHSSRFLLAFFIFTIITILVCLAAFLIDVLMFVPNIAWGSWIVLASTIMVILSAVVTCAMRRSLISRKNRRKLVVENDEMNGQTYYSNEAAKPVDPMAPAAIPLIGTVTNTSATGDNLPAFATFEDQKKDDQVSDERVPLTRKPSSTSGPQGSVSATDLSRTPPRADRYGNPINDAGAYGVARNPTRGPPLQNGYRGRGGPYGGGGYGGGGGGRGGYDTYAGGAPPMRGRGGYGPPGRGGGYPMRGRGGYGPPTRGGYGRSRGGYGGGPTPPPPGPGYYDSRRQPTADPYGPGSGSRQASADDYNSASNLVPAAAVGAGAGAGAVVGGALPQSFSNSSSNYEPYNPDARAPDLPRAESPPAMGDGVGVVAAGNLRDEVPPVAAANDGGPVEMDATPAPPKREYTPYNGALRESDSDVVGMVGLQQGRPLDRHNTYMSDGSRYSTDDQFHPARTGWTQQDRTASPLNVQQPTGNLVRSGSGNYYEDVDPRFQSSPNLDRQPPQQSQRPPQAVGYDEDVHALNNGARSPAESERSTFTSISQRGINPYWNGGGPGPSGLGPAQAPPPLNYGGGGGGIPPRRPVPAQQQRQDMLLDNPDFQLPGGAGASKPGTGGGRMPPAGTVPGSAYPGGGI
ncbi:SUR7/PalI family [Geosmithia morbida]|uniref:SUR7/PalI family n=1 Tax=Geosmithia morbida TaxID=1094350 RepID=A0A9P4YZH3_9HYPO|nr:SUR7/PalI family [Geosmithia morbida]KAF4124627.1 SUR7/PalI family [Geosmithia morbida]